MSSDNIAWWAMLWTAAQAAAVAAAFLIGWRQVVAIKKSGLVQATINAFDRWDLLFIEFRQNDFIMTPLAGTREHNESVLLDAFRHADPPKNQLQAIDLVNYFERCADLYYAGAIDKALFMRHMVA